MAAAGLGYAGVILLACITGTSFYSYNAGYGYSGWFYAANDVSIVIMLTAPFGFLPGSSTSWLLPDAAVSGSGLVWLQGPERSCSAPLF